MNIFVLDLDPQKAARQHCDKHVVKMVLESAQLLCTAHRVLDGAKDPKSRAYVLPEPSETDLYYKASHVNHPCAIWARSTSANYIWLSNMLNALCDEYYFRYGSRKKVPVHHKVARTGLNVALMRLPDNISDGPLTAFSLSMPDEYKVPGDPVSSYRAYYLGDKRGLLKYTQRSAPDWII